MTIPLILYQLYKYFIGVGAGPVLDGPLFLAVPAGPLFYRTTVPLEQDSNPTHCLHVLLAGPLFEAVLGHCTFAIVCANSVFGQKPKC